MLLRMLDIPFSYIGYWDAEVPLANRGKYVAFDQRTVLHHSSTGEREMYVGNLSRISAREPQSDQRSAVPEGAVAAADALATHLLQGIVCGIDELAADLVVLRVRADGPFPFHPGQYAKLRFIGGLERAYSIASVDGDRFLEFHIRSAGGATAATIRRLRVGDGIGISGPFGTSYLRRDHDGPVICVAGGTGLAPILSIVRALLEGGSKEAMHLYYGERDEADIYAGARLAAMVSRFPNLSLHIVTESEAAEPGRRTGMLTDALAADWANGDLDAFRAYVCGSPAMALAVRNVLAVRGLPIDRIHSDALAG